MVKSVSREQFLEAIADSAASPAFHEQYSRFVGLEELMDVEAVIYTGNVKVKGSYRVPSLCTLITGNLEVEDVLDLQSQYDRAGLFIVIGDVTCRHLLGDYELTGFVDGDLTAKDSIVTGFGDSALSVIGTLTTKLFIGCDIAAHVGSGALIEYGVGYCTPIGEFGAAPIQPQHDEAATAKIVVPEPKDEGYLFDAEQFADLIRAGKAIFR